MTCNTCNKQIQTTAPIVVQFYDCINDAEGVGHCVPVNYFTTYQNDSTCGNTCLPYEAPIHLTTNQQLLLAGLSIIGFILFMRSLKNK